MFIVRNAVGYEDVPVLQLILLWCSMPRITWLTALLVGVQPVEATNFSAGASFLFAEMILQVISSYYMIMTVSYGIEHNFYLGGMERLERATPAKFMYAGAHLWRAVVIVFSFIFVITLALVQLVQATCRTSTLIAADNIDARKWERSEPKTPSIREAKLTLSWIEEIWGLEEASSPRSRGGYHTVYGTLPVESQNNPVSQKTPVILYAAVVISMLLWIAQWLFWSGFIGLSLEEYVFMYKLGPYWLTGVRFCPPKLGVLTAIWIAFSLAGYTLGAI